MSAARPCCRFILMPTESSRLPSSKTAALNAALMAAVESSPDIYIARRHFSFAALDTTAAVATVRANGAQYRGSLLVAADGRNLPCGQALGIAVTRHDYGQTALVLLDHAQLAA